MAEQGKTDAEEPANGKPPEEEMAELKLELSEAWLAAIDRIAEKKGVSREELVVQILEDHLHKDDAL